VFFMEYDTDRAGDLAPLGELGKGHQRVMLGFITTKSGELESMDHLKRQFEKAASFVDMDQLGIAPQCGFASTEEGNRITADDQARKLALVLECANTLW
jgi:5-methyltetrahydropteroyltriglutamate--homocysteine methyltransferase